MDASVLVPVGLSGAVPGGGRPGHHEDVTGRMRRLLRIRPLVIIGGFAATGAVVLRRPVAGMVLISLCLLG